MGIRQVALPTLTYQKKESRLGPLNLPCAMVKKPCQGAFSSGGESGERATRRS